MKIYKQDMTDIISSASNMELEKLDDSWVTEDSLDWINDDIYDKYNTEPITSLNVNLVYINANNEIEKIIEEYITLNQVGTIERDELIRMVKRWRTSNNIKYKLLSLLVYIVDLQPDNIKKFLSNNVEDVKTSYNNFLKPLTKFDLVNLKKSISLFHDLNGITIIYHRPKNTKNIGNNKLTKKYSISNSIKYTRKTYDK